MSQQPVHVGECPPMLFHAPWGPDRRPIIVQPWPRFQVFTRELVVDSPFFALVRYDEEPEDHKYWLWVDVANGWARYRNVGYDHQRGLIIAELVEGEYEPVHQEGVEPITTWGRL